MSDDDNKLLFNAIANNDIATATLLIARGLVNGSPHRRPLVDAAAGGRLEIMTLLLDAGARINADDARRKSPCHIAIQSGQLAALRLLVSRGADLSRVDDNNCSLFDIATFQSDDRFVLFLLGLGLPTDQLLRWFEPPARAERRSTACWHSVSMSASCATHSIAPLVMLCALTIPTLRAFCASWCASAWMWTQPIILAAHRCSALRPALWSAKRRCAFSSNWAPTSTDAIDGATPRCT
jgi:hypothetical protein